MLPFLALDRPIASGWVGLTLVGAFVLGSIAPAQAQGNAPSRTLDLNKAIASCVDSTARYLNFSPQQNQEFCQCAFNRLGQTYSSDRLIEIAQKFQETQQFPAELLSVAADCSTKLLNGLPGLGNITP